NKVEVVFGLDGGVVVVWRPAHANDGGDLSSSQLFDREIVVEIGLNDVDAQRAEDIFRAHGGDTQRLPEIDLLSLQVAVASDVLTREHVKFRAEQLRDVLNALFCVGVQRRVLLLEVVQVAGVGRTHIDAAQKKDVVKILSAAAADHRQHTQAVRIDAVEHILNIFGKARVGA